MTGQIRDAAVPLDCCFLPKRRGSCDPSGRCRYPRVAGDRGRAVRHGEADDDPVAVCFALRRRRDVPVLHSYCSRFVFPHSFLKGTRFVVLTTALWVGTSRYATLNYAQIQRGWDSLVNEFRPSWRLEL
jgi:hypothetical protein